MHARPHSRVGRILSFFVGPTRPVAARCIAPPRALMDAGLLRTAVPGAFPR
jgi:hypothetical protein